MKQLAENLTQAQAGSDDATTACLFVFQALTNDKNMREIIRGTKDDYAHFQTVI